MNNEINYQNNPLHGISLKNVLIELVDHYGFEMLFAYLNINCFGVNPSIESSAKFLKKTDWAREKVEVFYLYEFKNLPRVSSEQLVLSPRDRVVPAGQVPGKPAELSLDDAERLREKRAKKSAAYGDGTARRPNSVKKTGAQEVRRHSVSTHKEQHAAVSSPAPSAEAGADPWGKWKNKT